jgi:hypothetical protein
MEELRADYALTHAEEGEEDAEVSREAEIRAIEIDGGDASTNKLSAAESEDGRKSDKKKEDGAESGKRENDDGAVKDGVSEGKPGGFADGSSKLLQKLLGSKEKKGAKARKVISKAKDAVEGKDATSDGRMGENGAGRVGKIVLTEPGRGTLVQSKWSGVGDEGKARRDAKEDASERFETNVLEILSRGQFEALTSRDLELTAALNEDYLLTLPINVDWKSSSKEAIIFRCGRRKLLSGKELLGFN